MEGQKCLRGAGVTEINTSRDGREGEDEMAAASSVKVGGALSLPLPPPRCSLVSREEDTSVCPVRTNTAEVGARGGRGDVSLSLNVSSL